MAGMLERDVSPAWKKFFCQQLSLIGTADEVPHLARLLNDTTLGFYARYALERIPGDRSTDALREAAATSGGLTLVGQINALGEKEDSQAIELLGRYVRESHDIAVRGAAIHALGKIGGPDAVQLLRASPTDSSLRGLVAESLLRSAERCESGGELSAAAAVYTALNSSQEPPLIRASAFAGLIRCQPDPDSSMIIEALRSDDDILHSGVLRLLRETSGKRIAAVVAARTSTLPASTRAQMFYALADVGERRALPEMYAAITHPDRSLQAAAFSGIGKLGDSSSVGRLCSAMNNADVQQGAAIRKSLVRLRGPGVDERLTAFLTAKATAACKEQIIAVLTARDCREAVPALLCVVKTGGAKIRKAGIDALGMLGEGSISAELARMLNADQFASETPSLVRALTKIGQRDQTPDRVRDNVLAELPRSRPGTRAALFQVLGQFGGEKSYHAIRSALGDRDPNIRTAAIRVLSGWPDSAPLEDLLTQAHAADDAGRQTLALRGAVNLLEKAPDLTEEDKVTMIEREIRCASTSEAKILLLSALGKQSSRHALHVAVSCLDQPGIEDEAALAVVSVVRAMGKSSAVEGHAALERALKSVQSNSIAQQVRTERARLEFRTGQGKINTAVVTGGHEFDEPTFLALFASDEEIVYTHLPQVDESDVFEEIDGWPYDVIILYNFTQKISERRRENFLRLLDEGVGVLSLHHASGAFQEWCEYPKIIGCRYLLSPMERNGVRREPSTYRHDVDIPVHVTDTTHPVTDGIRDFTVRDETYRGCDFEPDNHLLLTTTEPSSDAPLGWARTYRHSRIVHSQLGHGPDIFANEQYRKLIRQAVRWCAEGRREQIRQETNNREAGK